MSDDHAGAAEHALVTFRAVVPDALGFVDAAALPVALETATRSLDQLRVGDGTTLFLNGASGGIGSTAVQLDRTFALDRIADAHRASEAGRVRGRVVLVVPR